MRWSNCTVAAFSNAFSHHGDSASAPSGASPPSISGQVL